jgi:hypothetical protein
VTAIVGRTLDKVHRSGPVAPIEHPLDIMQVGRRGKARLIKSCVEQFHTLAEATLRQALSSQAVSAL